MSKWDRVRDAARFRLALLEHTLLLNGGGMADLRDFEGKLPLPPREPLPARRPVSVQEFEADMRVAHNLDR